MKQFLVKNRYQFIVCLLLIVGVAIRFIGLGVIPGGINNDEAYAGYEAYSMLQYGLDSHGYHNPVYFVAWGSGMSVLQSYMMLPFIWLFGLHNWVIRIPEVIVACCSLPVFFLLLKKLHGREAALIGLFLLAINPWHIMMSRWALDCNLAPGFLLFGFWFFILGLEKPKYFLLSALMYGFSLYTYATIWLLLPFVLLFQVLYCSWFKKIKISLMAVLSMLLLGIMALPLVLFLLINLGFIGEIKTGFLSIPKLIVSRAGEYSIHGIGRKVYDLYYMLWKQEDGNLWNATADFGLFYKFSWPVILFGLCVEIRQLVKSLKTGFMPRILPFFQLGIGLILGCFYVVNMNRINYIYLPLLYFNVLGLTYLYQSVRKEVFATLSAAYAISFIAFSAFYFSYYEEDIGVIFQKGLDQCIEVAQESEKDIYLNEVSFPKVLFYSQTPVLEFLETVEYSNYPNAYLEAASFNHYYFYFEPAMIDNENAYIFETGSMDLQLFYEQGMSVETYDSMTVAY